ncbi:MAG: phenylacetate-CoA oxygenase subunit PaaJ [Hymenobacteraceae bacterium]|nr:phenylacetate-CoA oxygenase subunit PaaJ [Hymenobacteraceae bacterium]
MPVLSLVDLGVITEVKISDDEQVTVEMTPTFAGCPAMDYMKNDVEKTLEKHGVKNYKVNMSFDKPWNSNRVTEKGRKALKDFGLAPPPMYQNQDLILDIDILEHVPCPHCNSTNTDLKTPFGPTLCRSMHYCNDCKQMFEQFKPL